MTALELAAVLAEAARTPGDLTPAEAILAELHRRSYWFCREREVNGTTVDTPIPRAPTAERVLQLYDQAHGDDGTPADRELAEALLAFYLPRLDAAHTKAYYAGVRTRSVGTEPAPPPAPQAPAPPPPKPKPPPAASLFDDVATPAPPRDNPAPETPEPAPAMDTPAPSTEPPEASGMVEVEPIFTGSGSLAEFLGSIPLPRQPDWTAQEPPNLDAADTIVLNIESNGLDWAHGDKAIGVTVGTLDGQIKRFLPFAFQGGGNLDEGAVIRYLQALRNKHIVNAHTSFDIHMGHTIGVDFEAQGCTVSDVMLDAALLDDHRKRFALDVLAKDYLGGIEVPRLDERNMAQYSAAEVAARAEYQVQLVAELRNVMWPQLVEQDLLRVQKLESDTIFPVVEMEKNGALIDVERLDAMSAECTARYAELMKEIIDEAGFHFEHTSTSWGRLFEKCGLDPSEDGYKEEIVTAIGHPLIQKAYRAGQYASLNSKVFAPYKKQVGSDGILYFDIHQLRGDAGGTVSGRFSIGYVQQVPNHDNHHVIFGSGLPEDCDGSCPLFPRQLFIAANGDVIEADAAQVEYRLFAHFAKNKEVLDAYAADPWMSFHRKMWAMFKEFKPLMLYTHQKNLDFAKQYGAKAIKLATMMGFISAAEATEIRAAKRWDDPRLAEAKEMEKIFKQVMPEGDYLLDRAAHLAKSSCDNFCKQGDQLHRDFEHRGYVKTITGRRRRFPDNYKPYTALNGVLQGSGADILKMKLCELHRERKFTGLRLRLTVHDSVMGDGEQPETFDKYEKS